MSIPYLISNLGLALILAAVGFGIVYLFSLEGTLAKLVIAGFCLIGLGIFLAALLGSGPIVIGLPD